MNKSILTIAIASILSTAALADDHQVPTATFTELEANHFALQSSEITQTNLNANIAAGSASYGGGVTVQQSGHVDSDARPATTFALNSDQRSLELEGNRNHFELDASHNTLGIQASSSGVDGQGHVTNAFQGQNVGGASSLNTVDNHGNVYSSNVTSQAPVVIASQDISASGNANAGGYQAGGAGGQGNATGGAAAIDFSHSSNEQLAIQHNSFEFERASLPVVSFNR